MVHPPVRRGHQLREEMVDSPVMAAVFHKRALAEHANARDECVRPPGQDDGMLPTRLCQPEADLQRAQVEVAPPLELYTGDVCGVRGVA